jgi:8-oxo-dGTP pyrophosphatase MutT (NUDIX family)
MNHALPQLLAEQLARSRPEPRTDARFELQPFPKQFAEVPGDVRAAAVLVLLYPREGGWHLPLTLRPAHLADHAGQVSLPGGAVESGETSAQAAIREFHEELGDDGQPIRLLGSLSPRYVHASNYLVTPWVAAVASQPLFVRNPMEVEQILEVPLAHLLDPANIGSHARQYQGQAFVAPHFIYQAHHIWGATCGILGEFVTLLETMQICEP